MQIKPTDQVVSWVFSQGWTRQVPNDVVFAAADINCFDDDLRSIPTSSPSEEILWLNIMSAAVGDTRNIDKH